MNASLERLVALKSAATTTSAQIDYLDLLLTDTVRLCQRPGDVERTAAHLDELLTEVATARASQRPSAAHRSPNDPTDAPAPVPTPHTGAHALTTPGATT